MKRKLEVTELIFKILSYTFLTVFALCCLYPFLYAISASMSGIDALEGGKVVLFPKDIQFEAFASMFIATMCNQKSPSTMLRVQARVRATNKKHRPLHRHHRLKIQEIHQWSGYQSLEVNITANQVAAI